MLLIITFLFSEQKRSLYCVHFSVVCVIFAVCMTQCCEQDFSNLRILLQQNYNIWFASIPTQCLQYLHLSTIEHLILLTDVNTDVLLLAAATNLVDLCCSLQESALDGLPAAFGSHVHTLMLNASSTKLLLERHVTLQSVTAFRVQCEHIWRSRVDLDVTLDDLMAIFPNLIRLFCPFSMVTNGFIGAPNSQIKELHFGGHISFNNIEDICGKFPDLNVLCLQTVKHALAATSQERKCFAKNINKVVISMVLVDAGQYDERSFCICNCCKYVFCFEYNADPLQDLWCLW